MKDIQAEQPAFFVQAAENHSVLAGAIIDGLLSATALIYGGHDAKRAVKILNMLAANIRSTRANLNVAMPIDIYELAEKYATAVDETTAELEKSDVLTNPIEEKRLYRQVVYIALSATTGLFLEDDDNNDSEEDSDE